MTKLLSLSTRLQAITVLMVALLLGTIALSAASTFQRLHAARQALAIVDITQDLFEAMQDLRVERGTVNTALATPAVVKPGTWDDIQALRRRSETALESALAKLAVAGPIASDHDVREIRTRLNLFIDMRRRADAALHRPQAGRPADLGPRWVAADTQLVDAMARLSDQISDKVVRADPFIGQMMTTKQLAWAARDAAGTDRLRVGEAIAKGKRLAPEQLQELVRFSGRIEMAWKIIQNDVRMPSASPQLKAAVAAADRTYFAELGPRRQALVDQLAAGQPVSITGDAWVRLSNPGLASLVAVAGTALDLAEASATREAAAAERDFYGMLALMIVVFALGALTTLFIVDRIARPMARITQTMRQVADGDLDDPIPFLDRGDEIGQLARALGVFRDNALEKARMAGELLDSKIATEAAEAANRLKSQFLANMSHEIRTPLNGVLGMAQAMEIDDLSGEQADRLRVIRESGESLLQVLNHVLDISKIEAGKLDLCPVQFDVFTLVSGACATFAEAASAKGIGFDFAIAKDALGVWCGDEVRIRQILLNMMSNAVKFTDRGQVRVEVERTDEGLCFAVHDSGVGIDEADLPKLFQKFSQVDDSNTRRYGGTGLGLAICRELSTLMGGDIEVRSTPGAGSVFHLSLPLSFVGFELVDDGADPASVMRRAPLADQPVRILAAEDNPANQKVLAALLAPLGAELTIVGNGLEVVEAWKTSAWDLVLMDIQMPEMGGVAAASCIRAAETERGLAPVPIIALSANAMRHQVEEYLAAGMTAHIAKPIRLSELYAALSAALAPSGDRPVQAAAARL